MSILYLKSIEGYLFSILILLHFKHLKCYSKRNKNSAERTNDSHVIPPFYFPLKYRDSVSIPRKEHTTILMKTPK